MRRPQFICTHQGSEIGYHFTKLGINLKDLYDLYLTRLDGIKNMNNGEGVQLNQNTKVGLKFP